MGVDKAVLDLNGRPMALRVADTLRQAGALEVLAVGGRPEWAKVLVGVDRCDEWVPDLHPGDGPLGGVVTAAAARPNSFLVVAACDLPDLRPAVVEALIVAAGETGAAVAATGGRTQWGLMALSPHVASGAVTKFAEGARQLRAAAPGARVVPVDRSAGFDDLDGPADVDRWQEAHRRQG